MNEAQFQNLCVESSAKYLNFLKANNNNTRGNETINVKKIDTIDAELNIFKINLSNKIYNIDYIYYSFGFTNAAYSQLQLKIIEYDEDNRTLLIEKLDKNIDIILINQHIETFYVISDLRYLIENINTWYSNNLNYLNFNLQNSTIPEDKIFCLDECDASQRQAISTIFKNPLTYIWGPPGTGKTQKVLASAIITYIKAGEKLFYSRLQTTHWNKYCHLSYQ